MRETIDIATEQIAPSTEDILVHQGVPSGFTHDEPTLAPAREAIALWHRLAQPRGVFAEISTNDFARVYSGDHRNEAITPLTDIYARSSALALFAVTIGGAVEQEIRRLFEINEFPLGSMLDAAASVSADKAVSALQDVFQSRLEQSRRWSADMGLMPFSPGYCGWHVSGQRALFEVLRPGDIGIELSDSCLMQPLKSVSGMFVAGQKEIFDFDDDFAFCGECATRSCRDRIKSLLGT